MIRVFGWIVHTTRLNHQEKIGVIEKLQTYIDSKKVDINRNIPISTIIDGKRVNDYTTDQIITKFGSLKDWALYQLKYETSKEI
jgi:hypothetical protein